MDCNWEILRELPDGRKLVVCPICGVKRTIKKPLKRECQPDLVIKKRPCKGCPKIEDETPTKDHDVADDGPAAEGGGGTD